MVEPGSTPTQAINWLGGRCIPFAGNGFPPGWIHRNYARRASANGMHTSSGLHPQWAGTFERTSLPIPTAGVKSSSDWHVSQSKARDEKLYAHCVSCR